MRARLTLERGRWYGWTMWPGYLDAPYFSPIRVDAVNPLNTGSGRFDLDFLNAGYASGVQDMTYALRTLKREASYLLASVEDSDRAVCIERLDLAWLERNMRDSELPFAIFREFANEPGFDPITDWLDVNYPQPERPSS